MNGTPLDEKRWFFWLNLFVGLALASQILRVAGVPEGLDRNWAQWIVAIVTILGCARFSGWIVWLMVLWLKPELIKDKSSPPA
ncbi:hypothetical protein IP84_11710 [beta proteobacterium AAP99]|nr:hypothetical protein IP84_11710 [beta proteobacterium AAP99]